MTELAGQRTLFDVERFPSVFDPEGYEIAYCRACHSNWGAERARTRRSEQERIEQNHELQADGPCLTHALPVSRGYTSSTRNPASPPAISALGGLA